MPNSLSVEFFLLRPISLVTVRHKVCLESFTEIVYIGKRDRERRGQRERERGGDRERARGGFSWHTGILELMVIFGEGREREKEREREC